MTPQCFAVGQEVKVHPASDMWMRGYMHGRVAKAGRKYVHVRMYRNERIIKMNPNNLIKVEM